MSEINQNILDNEVKLDKLGQPLPKDEKSQSGGSSFNMIYEPETGKSYSIYSKKGVKILNKLIRTYKKHTKQTKQQKGGWGSRSIDDDENYQIGGWGSFNLPENEEEQ